MKTTTAILALIIAIGCSSQKPSKPEQTKQEFVKIQSTELQTNELFILKVNEADLPKHWALETANYSTDHISFEDAGKLDWKPYQTFILGTNEGTVQICVPIGDNQFLVEPTSDRIIMQPVVTDPAPANLFRLRKL